MDSSYNCHTLQLRLEKCILKESIAPAQYSFCLNTQKSASKFTSWKQPKGLILSFHCFLRIKIDDFRQNMKCYLQFYSRSNAQQRSIGSLCLTIRQDKCDKIRKYTVQNDGKVIATIQVSIFLKEQDNSLPIFPTVSSQIQSHSGYSTISNHSSSIQVDSILDNFKSNPESIIHHEQSNKFSSKLRIERALQMMVQHQFQAEDAQKLLIKLFKDYGKEDAEIERKQAYLDEREAQIKHIKIKELIINKDEKKIKRLKRQTGFLLAAHEVLNSRDQRYNEQYQQMKSQKQQMEVKMKQVSQQTHHKINSLKAELQVAKKKLENRQKKVSSLIEQVKIYTKEINTLKDDNKQKSKLINKIKIELHNQQAKMQFQRMDIFSLIAKIANPENQQTNTKEPSQQIIKKYKSVSLFKGTSQRQFKIQPQKKNQNIKLPNIVSYLLNLGSQQ